MRDIFLGAITKSHRREQMEPTITCAESVVDTLKAAGIVRVFGHPGGEVIGLIDALERKHIDFVLTGHEGAAGFMAQTVGRLTGIPGVCLSTLGPGACNLVLGVASALLDRDPLLAFSARTARDRESWSNKQNLRLNDMMEVVSKWSVALHGCNTEILVKAATLVATSPPLGSVYLTIPDDIASDRELSGHALVSPPPPIADDERNFETILNALNQARRPAAVVGCALGRRRDRAAIDEFLTESGIPFAVTPQGKGMVDETRDNFVGAVASAAADMPIVEMLRQSDCILGLGFDAVESGQSWHHKAPMYSPANAPTGYVDYQPVECNSDVSALVRRLKGRFSSQMMWTAAEIEAVRSTVRSLLIPDTSATREGMSPYHMVRALQEALPADTLFTTDVGAHKMLVTQAWQARDPLGFLITNGLSGMGFGMPSAIAAALTFPDRPVVSLVGDGGFGMVVQELETARRLGAAVLVVVCCDQALSVIKVAQDERALPYRGVDFAPTDWARVSDGFGVRSHSVSSLEQLQKAATDWASRREPMVIAAAIDASLYTGLMY